MAQITSGIRAVLSNPKVYDLFQNLMGAHSVRQEFVSEHIRPLNGYRILDIGCGTARILDYLPDVEYHGFDLSRRYIDDATQRYGTRGHFKCALVEQTTLNEMEPFDIVLATGLLHHLGDEQVNALMGLAWSALKEGGRLITMDPCYATDQNVVSRFLVNRDRGLNVRDLAGYSSLAKTMFTNTAAIVKHRSWIPYTHCIMECTK